MRKAYIVIDLEKRSEIDGYEVSELRDIYILNTVVEVVIGDTYGKKVVKYYYDSSTMYYVIPEGCYIEVTKEKNPEYYL